MKDKIRIKANNSDGFYFLESGGGINLSYPESKSRRGRVIEEGRICPTITTGGESIGIMEKVQHIRIKTYNSDEFCYLESGGYLISLIRLIGQSADELRNAGIYARQYR